MNLTVFVVDDDDAIRSSLSRALRKRGYEVEAFASAEAFLGAWNGQSGGCLILDHGMPGMSGLELQKRLAGQDYLLPIIFITGHGGVPESVQAIKAGAVDFLEKPFRQAVLVERIETALGIASERLAAREGCQKTRARFDRLTAREAEIVDHMVENPSGTSSKEVGARLGISPRTVDHHRARIMEKLGIRSVAELIALAGRPGGQG
ncbi:response regulator transcription factor [Pseudogemmobacter humi]|uniref:Response regulator protein TmoT n=1 Tax=Pseudogemmobacter humi TaxID=2483812 RepID=A0A3P5X3R3_9RHOB|nr:response regulator [Pseudogemmobacter humi]VDC25156.1 Response regulator protein TmoT [Pseudogemmobacter humi]